MKRISRIGFSVIFILILQNIIPFKTMAFESSSIKFDIPLVDSLRTIIDTSYVLRKSPKVQIDTVKNSEIITELDTVEVFFRQDIDVFEPLYKDNGRRIEDLISRFKTLKQSGDLRVKNIIVRASASPEGRYNYNQALSKRRAYEIVNHIFENNLLERENMEVEWIGVDWEGLKQLVAKSNMKEKNKVVDIIENTPLFISEGGRIVSGRKKILMDLNGGRTWKYMYAKFFPQLRKTYVSINYDLTKEQVKYIERDLNTDVIDTVLTVRHDTISVTDIAIPRARKPFYMALKTNLLYDAVLLPAIGVEFYLGHKYSIEADWHYTWFYSNKSHKYWQSYGGELELRKYFGDFKPLNGPYLGAYIQTNTFDIEFGHKGWQQADWHFGGGISAGWSIPLAKRINMDFNIGVGYFDCVTDEYVPRSDYYLWKSRTQRHWFGPTKAAISLVWLIGRGNYNKR